MSGLANFLVVECKFYTGIILLSHGLYYSLSMQPYEQVGNSIGYQLLHQNHSDVTTDLIDRLYPALKVHKNISHTLNIDLSDSHFRH